jgi:hypothetical protein
MNPYESCRPSNETVLRDFERKLASSDVASHYWMRGDCPWDMIADVRRLGLDVAIAGETWRRLEAEVVE